MKIKRLVLFTASLVCCLLVFPGATRQATVLGQNIGDAPQYATLVKRVKTAENDNYTQAAFSFKYGVNGDGALKLTRNNWDLLFGNSPTPDAFDVTMVTDDCSRIKDLGELNWADCFDVPALPALSADPGSERQVDSWTHVSGPQQRQRQRSLLVVQGRGVNTSQSVTISWILIPEPQPVR